METEGRWQPDSCDASFRPSTKDRKWPVNGSLPYNRGRSDFPKPNAPPVRGFSGASFVLGRVCSLCRGIDVRTGDPEQAEKRERRRTVFLRKHDFLVGVFLSSVADHDGLSEKMELWRRSLGSGRATTGATDTFSRRPLSVASRPFMGGS
jgi:hypothetical protein